MIKFDMSWFFSVERRSNGNHPAKFRSSKKEYGNQSGSRYKIELNLWKLFWFLPVFNLKT